MVLSDKIIEKEHAEAMSKEKATVAKTENKAVAKAKKPGNNDLFFKIFFIIVPIFVVAIPVIEILAIFGKI